MHLPIATTLAALATSAVALPTTSNSNAGEMHSLAALPANLSAGIHRFEMDASGKPNITRVGELDHTPRVEARDGGLEKRVNTWTGCEGYSFTTSQRGEVENAWASLLNWASSQGTGTSTWIDGHYFALEDSGVFAYLCEWGRGNHVKVSQVNQAHAVVNYACANGPGIFQWNEWKKGVGAAAGKLPVGMWGRQCLTNDRSSI